jgi:hypothetical protein
MGFWKAFLKLDRRFIYLVIALGIIIPLLKPMGLPILPSKEVQAVFDDIDKLPPGSHVWIAMDYDPASQPELQPMSVAIMRHCFEKDLRVIAMTLWPGGPNLIVEAFHKVSKEFGDNGKSLKEGENYVNLGYKPGGTAVILGAGQDLKATFPTDMFGNATSTMPILRDLNSTKNLDYMVEIGAGNTVDWWIVYGQKNYGFPLAIGCTAVSASQYYPYLNSGQITGLIGGLRGAAEYEVLTGKPDLATAGMDAQSIVHVILVLAIILANIGYITVLRGGGAK